MPGPSPSLLPTTVAALHKRLLDWYTTHQRDLPWRRTADPYAILVAEIMLQQTQVERVQPKYQQFLQRFPTWAALASAPTREVIRAWSSLGYNQRALRLQKIAQQVVGQRDGRLPESMLELLTLQGVGRYTAAALASFVYHQDMPVLDTNVRRVLLRLVFDDNAVGEAELWKAAAALVPEGRSAQWNQALMDVGATLCRTLQPRCRLCPLRELCVAAPRLQGRRVAERAVRYRTCSAPFRGSTRYYRGRIVERLRGVSDGQNMDLDALGRAIKPDFTGEDLSWLLKLLRGLERDGLAVIRESAEGDGSIRKPTVALP